jgi:hypothetical protein
MNMKSSIHFSPDAERQKGALCHRISVQSQPWSIQFSVTVTKGAFLFLATEEACPFWMISRDLEGWSGISINISHRDDSKHKTMRIIGRLLGENINAAVLFGKVPGNTATLNISASENTLGISVVNSSGSYPLGSRISFNSTRIFFSFVATSFHGIGDSSISSVYGNAEPSEEADVLDNVVRREITVQSGEIETFRKPLELATKIIKEIEQSKNLLADRDPKETAETIRNLFREVLQRLQETLFTSDLDTLVHTNFAYDLMRAEKKMEKRKTAFGGVSQDLTFLKKNVDEKVRYLKDYVVEVMNGAKKDAVDTLKVFLNATKDAEKLAMEAKKGRRESKYAFWPVFLFVIALMELVCYLAFFFVKRSRTHGFKKLD